MGNRRARLSSSEPFAEDTALRDRETATVATLPVGSPARALYKPLVRSAEADISDALREREEFDFLTMQIRCLLPGTASETLSRW